MVQNMKKVEFHTFFTVTSQQWYLLRQNWDFWVPWDIPDQIDRICCPKFLYFFEKMHKVFKNKAQGCCTPLSAPYRSFTPSLDCIMWKNLIYLWFLHNLFKILSPICLIFVAWLELTTLRHCAELLWLTSRGFRWLERKKNPINWFKF